MDGDEEMESTDAFRSPHTMVRREWQHLVGATLMQLHAGHLVEMTALARTGGWEVILR